MIAPSQLPHLIDKISTPTPGAPVMRMPRRRHLASPGADVAIRYARSQDDVAVRELEELDGHLLTDGARLLAEVDGVPVAAIAVTDDSVVADPFAPTAAVVDLLRIRARQLRIAA